MKKLAIVLGLFTCLQMLRASESVNIPLYSVTWNNVYTESIVTLSSGRNMRKDDPGSSTVDPLDPNLGRAELINNTLLVQESFEGSVQIVVSNVFTDRIVLYDLFDGSITFTITDDATYMIYMRPTDGPDIYGYFIYPSGMAQKELKNGTVLIRRGAEIFSPSGMKIQ